jgi:hypothetical protein
MNRKFAAFISVSLALIALFLPWTGGLTIAGAAASSVRYISIGLNMAWSDVILILAMTAMLLAYPLTSCLLHCVGTQLEPVKHLSL